MIIGDIPPVSELECSAPIQRKGHDTQVPHPGPAASLPPSLHIHALGEAPGNRTQGEPLETWAATCPSPLEIYGGRGQLTSTRQVKSSVVPWAWQLAVSALLSARLLRWVLLGPPLECPQRGTSLFYADLRLLCPLAGGKFDRSVCPGMRKPSP